LAAARGLEVEDHDDLLALDDDVVVEEVAVDDALRQLRLEVVLEVVDLVVERARDALEVRRQATPDLAVEVRHALEAEAVLDALLLAFAGRGQVRQPGADVLELCARQTGGVERAAVVEAVHGETLPAGLAVIAALAVGERLRAREAVLAQEEEQVQLALHLELALHLVDADEAFSAGGLDEGVGVDGA